MQNKINQRGTKAPHKTFKTMKAKTQNTKTQKAELITSIIFSAFFFGSIANAIISTIN